MRHLLKIIIFVLLPIICFSQIKDFQGTIDDDWSKPGNWSGGTLPTAANDVYVVGGIIAKIYSGNYNYNILVVKEGGTLTIASGVSVAIVGETKNLGILNIDGDLSSASLRNGSTSGNENEDKVNLNGGSIICTGSITNYNGNFVCDNSSSIQATNFTNGTSWSSPAKKSTIDLTNLSTIALSGNLSNAYGNITIDNSSVTADGFVNGNSANSLVSNTVLTNSSSLTIAATIDNTYGEVNLSSSTLTAYYGENQASQTFVVNASTVTIKGASGSYSFINKGVFDVKGLSTIDSEISRFYTHTGGVFNVASGSTLSFAQNELWSCGTLNVDGAITGTFNLWNGSSFTGPGTLNVSDGSSIDIIGTIYNYQGTVNVDGEIKGTVRYNAGNSAKPLLLANTNVSSTGKFSSNDIYNYVGVFNIDNPALFTASSIENSSGQELKFKNATSTVSGGITNNGIIKLDGNIDITGDLTVKVGSTISTIDNSSISLDGDFTNEADLIGVFMGAPGIKGISFDVTGNFNQLGLRYNVVGDASGGLGNSMSVGGDLTNTGGLTFGNGTPSVLDVGGDIINTRLFTVHSKTRVTVVGDISNTGANGVFEINSADSDVNQGTGSVISATVSGDGVAIFRVQRWIDKSKTKWQLVSSPLSTEHSSVFKGHYLNYYNELPGKFVAIAPTNTPMPPGEGFGAKFAGDQGVVPTPNPMVFEDGIYNCGDVPRGLVEKGVGETTLGVPAGFNLVGNPYQAPINWEKVYLNNSGVVSASLYYYIQGSGWLTYNANTTVGDNNAEYINVGQGFGVKLLDNNTSGQELIFKNSDRVHKIGNGFQKKGKTFSNYFELNSKSNNYSDKIYFRFNEDATSEFDDDYDAYKLNPIDVPSPSVSFISSKGKKLAICETPSSETVDLGFNMEESGEVTFSISNFHDFSEIIIEDAVENKFVNLLKDTYTFNYSNEEDEIGRFKLHFKQGTLSEANELTSLKVYSNRGDIYIKNNIELTNVDVSIYSISGQLVYSNNYPTLQNKKIETQFKGIYILKIASDNGVSTSKLSLK